ncbi:ribonuclease D [Gloeocapsopsis dulcis]|uniref:Ribonuclease D n=1 Tax=Gloeocapsopsis dulcis AAB1 = 1H9 TaxID=1433147 RepID=A0A6N8FS61_9CHRO|nr:ribonuclease D [Gloeocapsopsis dulcis]MUL35027.1 ribonuclease D [Gloeocapsopsis dulcis AAB1 = 1H9]WNN89895.1 ribonuclease D [Gloeocapsopsis dulcis]
MFYLENTNEASILIAQYSQEKVLWVDTEIADFNTRNPRLSLIQFLSEPNDITGQKVIILDVLDQPEVAEEFICKVMFNSTIEKVFHQASYDLKFLGKNKAKNITCTLEMAKKIPYYLLPLPNLSLKTLVEALCHTKVDKSAQASDWGQRPLSDVQLNYAKMDPVYLAMIHQRLLQLQLIENPDPATEDLEALAARYLKLKQQLQLLSSEYEHIETRLKAAMQTQKVLETDNLKLSQSQRKTIKAEFAELATVIQEHGIEFNFPITLTQKLQKELGDIISELSLQVETTNSWRLTAQQSETINQQNELDF